MRLSSTMAVYIGRHFLFSLFATLLVIMGLILLFDTVELMRRAAARPDTGLDVLLGMALLKLPNMLHKVLPFGVMIAALVVLWRLSRSHELTVLRAAGVSAWQFLVPPLVLALLVGVVDITAVNPLAATMYRSYERMEDTFVRRQGGTLSLPAGGGLWLREADGDGHTVVHAAHVRQEAFQLAMREVTIFELDDKDRFERRIEARLGTLDDGLIRLEQAWVLTPGQPAEQFERLELSTTLTLAKVQENFASPETLSFWELPDFIRFYEASGFSAQQHRVYWHGLIASPMLLCALVLVAAGFALNVNQRTGNWLLRMVLALGTGFLVYFFSEVTFALGLSETLPLALAAWSPALVTALFGMTLLFHLEDG
ncbi:LPS export ABC transporter permease LptG [Roseospirillum parvum]|uniref:Lipopolysaccharide export system permease protein n=1 Tax=Roseospirillum parvum TaxID=83401 RepID=A0A1G8BKC1_9PROT|nr:LPS export ABC transporter permease LptG [Roseospirillum parvum]SDH33655.1 lipopolysaccharide export system permease protein [Roseospirillum parvum]